MIESMYGMGVDTLKAARALEKAGFEPAQAEAMVAAFGGSVAGGAATREDLRDLRSASRDDNRALREEIAEVRTELKAEIAEVRTELKAEIAEVRTELKAEIAELRTELKMEIAELREETRAEFVAVREEIAGVRTELKAEIAEVRTELKAEIAELREETRAEFVAVREEMRTGFAAVHREMDVMKDDIADLKTEIVKVRSACHDDIKSLKAQMYGLLLAQATLIVGLVVGLQRLL